jgi:putative ABC transport system ATP-binding protein
MGYDDDITLGAYGLGHRFGSGAAAVAVLRDVSLELRRREVTLLMGPSGSGKTTLLATLSGLLRPNVGQVRVLNRDLWQRSEREREQFRLEHCGFILQGANLFPALTARQQLEMVLCWGEGISHREARPRVDQMLDLLGLARRAHARPGALSGGEKQRVAVGRALIKRPTFCFADEPTSALDWDRGRQVIDLLRHAAHAWGTTVLVVAHDPRIVEFADQVIHLVDGQLVQPTEVLP